MLCVPGGRAQDRTGATLTKSSTRPALATPTCRLQGSNREELLPPHHHRSVQQVSSCGGVQVNKLGVHLNIALGCEANYAYPNVNCAVSPRINCAAPGGERTLIHSGQYCVDAAGLNYVSEDLTNSGSSSFPRYGAVSVDECEQRCLGTAECNYFTYVESNNGDCLLYSACGRGKVYGNGQGNTYALALGEASLFDDNTYEILIQENQQVVEEMRDATNYGNDANQASFW